MQRQRVAIPSVDRLLNSADLRDLIATWGRESVLTAIRTIQERVRNESVVVAEDKVEAFYRVESERWLKVNRQQGHMRVFNMTGTVLHTNLGRALIGEALYDRVKPLVTRPASIEFDIETGKRGQREEAVCDRLCRLVNAEAAAIVNNNAAAVLIVLHTLARDRNVVVSRGELIEIGGSFRLPEVMEAAGCHLLEVGTTNRTHLRDYASATAKDVALLLKVHPSNYRIEGFTNEVQTRELSELAKQHNVLCVVDLGSGALVDTHQFGLPREPLPSDTLRDGADLVTFSGDKLLGGPQAGLIVGSRALVDRINANPMKRALRTSKLTLALLDETIKAYENPEQLREQIPTIQALAMPVSELQKRADAIHAKFSLLAPNDLTVQVEPSNAEVGSGALPGHTLPSISVLLRCATNKATEELLVALRRLPIPVIGRMHQRAIYLDVRGAEPLSEFIANLDALT